MIRFLAVLCVTAATALGEDEQLNPPAVEPQPVPLQFSGGPSLVAVAYDPNALTGLDENVEVTPRMVDALVRTVTGKNTAVERTLL